VVAQPLHIFVSSAVSCLGHLGYVVQKRAFCRAELRLIQLALDQRLYGLLFRSLNPQEVSVRVQSIRTTVQPGNPTGDRLFLAPVEVALGEVDGVAELDHLAKKIRPMAHALQNARHLLPAGLRPPFVVNGSHLACGVSILN
jgi:hypothetical protein